MSYFRATDPLPLQSPEQNKLHEFYERLGQGRLVTTACARCRRTAWPPRGFCGECASDQFTWVDLPLAGAIHAFTIQETGVPAPYESPRVFAIVKVGEARIFAPIVGSGATAVIVGSRVRLSPLHVAADAKGSPRHLIAFEPIEVEP
jgi:uncharacterized OB-fold protein